MMDAPHLMVVDESLMQAAAQAIDALSFAQTHVLDDDFRAHSRSTLDSVRALQQEQRNRIEQTYGARPPSTAFIASQLAATYRGARAAMALSKESPNNNNNGGDNNNSNNNKNNDSPFGIAAMPQAKCHAFKREMKQGIHEWERAFREEHGVNLGPQDKVSLRPMYELYKVIKYHLSENEPRSEMESNSNINNASMNNTNATVTLKINGVDFDEFRNPMKSDHAMSGAPVRLTMPHAMAAKGKDPSTFSTSPPPRLPSGTVKEKPTEAATAESASAAAAAAAIAPLTQSNISNAAMIGDTPAAEMSSENLAVEKRYIKRVLHHFESEFERQYGTLPTREDRRVLAREYSRYGELKNEIQRRMSEAATVNAPDGV